MFHLPVSSLVLLGQWDHSSPTPPRGWAQCRARSCVLPRVSPAAGSVSMPTRPPLPPGILHPNTGLKQTRLGQSPCPTTVP